MQRSRCLNTSAGQLTRYVLLLLMVITLFDISGVLGDESTLKSVVVVYRHGDRTPVDPYPNDPYLNKSYWPVGFGQLTNVGKEQHYEFGAWLRTRYNDFLPKDYSESDIYIRATDVDRTLMSAQANLAGLYPPVTPEDTWNADIPWQPIPVHTAPETDDIILAMKTNCPRYNYFMSQLMEEPYFQDLAKHNQPIYQYVTKNTGRKVSDILSLEFIYNTLFIEDLYNYTLPQWTKQVYPDVMRPLAALSFAIPCYNADLARLKVGPLLNDIYTRLKASAAPPTENIYHPRGNAPYIESHSKQDQPKKMWMYSAHDTTVANVLNALRVFDPHSPPYTSAVIIELRTSIARGTFVNIFYKNSSVATPITLPTCTFDCSLEAFHGILAPLMVSPSDWYVECEQLSLLSLLAFESIEGIVFFVLCVFILMIVTMLIYCIYCAKPNCEQRTYLRLPDDDQTV